MEWQGLANLLVLLAFLIFRVGKNKKASKIAIVMYSACATFFVFEKKNRGQNPPYMLKTYMTKRNKKSKYQSLLINKKRYYFYKITWLDIVGDSGHADSKEFMNLKPAEMISYGYIFSKDKICIRSFASYDSKEEAFSDRNVFPTGCVIKLEKINI